jgi:hypothetical protein
MSIEIMTENGRSRPTFVCDRCKEPIELDEGMLLWDPDDLKRRIQDTILVCSDCDSGHHFFSQELSTGLIYLLVSEGWLTQKFKPTEKLLRSARNALSLSQL